MTLTVRLAGKLFFLNRGGSAIWYFCIVDDRGRNCSDLEEYKGVH